MYRRDIVNDKENLYTAGTSDKNGGCSRTLDQSSNAAQERERVGSEEPEYELVLVGGGQSLTLQCSSCPSLLRGQTHMKPHTWN